ncbi:MAG: hypothetical protein K6C32_02940, partial [Bacilli bacterium]|nr:hypothetical protein [Bacilli bacterium]
MNIEKYVMLKVVLPHKDIITIGVIKDEFDVDADEALEMLNAVIQEGMVETFAYDGTHFRVIHQDKPL